jgi:soluble epoxide hydrolase/lipid-phosphate phosphatase
MSQSNLRELHRRMDPLDPTSFHHRRKIVNGLNMHFVDESGPKPSATVVLVHGFPDCWFGFRYQIGPLVKNGFRVLVPDMRGYGTSQGLISTEDSPEDVKRTFAKKNVCKDLVHLLDALHIKKAVFIGHDFGGIVAHRMPMHFPDRCLAVGTMATNYVPPAAKWITDSEMVKIAPLTAYQAFFTTDRAEAALNSDVELSLRVLLRSGGLKPHNPFTRPLPFFEQMPQDLPPADMTAQEFQYYTDTYCQSTFNGPLNWYRTRRFDFEDERNVPRRLTGLPVLYLFFGKDPVFKKSVLDEMPKLVENLDIRIIADAAHWGASQASTRDEVTIRLIEWLTAKFPSHAKL